MSLRHAVLGLLDYAPLSGYSIKKVFEISINHIWTAKLSQIYRELALLETEGLVSSKMVRQGKRPDKKVYTLTAKGRRAFLGWLNEFPVAFGPPRRDEFLLRIFFAAHMNEKLLKRELENFILMIETYRPLIHAGKIPELTDILARANQEAPGRKAPTVDAQEARFWRFTVRRFQLTADATLLWARECLAELEE